jgi:cob(I)alamin adenosyltransferase
MNDSSSHKAAPASPTAAASPPAAVDPASTATDAQLDAAHVQAMQDKQARRRAERATRTLRGGLLMVLTGPGKGKSSSAFGMVARALGWDMRVGIVQYIKGKWQTGERHFFRRFPDLVTYEVMGEGFTWDVQDRQRDIAAASKAWQRSREMIADPEYDFILLDELNIALRNDYLPLDEVVAFLRDRPRDKHICLTGRDAKPALLEIADLVTEMTLVKHPYQAGYKAQKGVEF